MPIIQHLGTAFASGGGSPFDNMGNFPNATRVGTTDVIYYHTPGSYTFTDPNGGASSYRFTVVGGGGATTGDGGGWYGVTGGGGGGCGRGTISTSNSLTINVAQGGASPGALGINVSSIPQTWAVQSATGGNNGRNRVYGRGGLSSVEYSGSALIFGQGGMTGMYGYHQTFNSDFLGWVSSGFNGRNGGRGKFHNGGTGYAASGGGITVTNTYTENGGTGGCAGHKDGSVPSLNAADRHPLDGWYQNNCNGGAVATIGQSTPYAGPGGGGGSNAEDTYDLLTGGGSTNIAGGAGGSASGLNTLLSGSLSSAGGNGSNYAVHTAYATVGTVGGGNGGNGRNGGSDTWNDSFYAPNGIVIVEWLG